MELRRTVESSSLGGQPQQAVARGVQPFLPLGEVKWVEVGKTLQEVNGVALTGDTGHFTDD